jgi:GNAT superfamily N-acetyltransferase
VTAGGRTFDLVLRAGRDRHGREVLTLDLLDPAAPERGTVAHADFAVGGEHASLNEPLRADRVLAGAVPPGADLTHWREGLWFGLAVLPRYRGLGLGARLMTESAALLRRAGVRRLFVTATDASRPFYLKVFAGRVRVDEPAPGPDGELQHELEIEL